VHIFQDLEQPPAFAMITFGWERAFSFEIYVVNQCVTALSVRGDAIELSLHVFTIRCLCHHFGQSILQTRDEKLGLEIDGIDQELAQLFHFRRFECLLKLDPGIPWAEGVVPGEKKLR
jgi:hypothetical protein